MRFCDQCGAALSLTGEKCVACGAAIADPTYGPIPAVESASEVAVVNVATPPGNPYQIHAISVIAVALIAGFALEFFSNRYASMPFWLALCWIGFLLTLVPLACGAILALACGPNTPKWMVSFSGWMDRRAARAKGSSGRFNDYVVSPAMWSYEALDGRANSVHDDILRNGAKAAAYAFALCLFLVLLYVMTVIIMLFAIAMFVGFLIEVFSPNRPEIGAYTAPQERKSLEATVYSGTNLFNEQVTGRVDVDGNVYEGTNVFNERKVGRVDAEGNQYEGTNAFNEQKIGRTDKAGNIFEGTNVFNERKAGRVDEDGNRFEGSNVFNERKTGRAEKKES